MIQYRKNKIKQNNNTNVALYVLSIYCDNSMLIVNKLLTNN